MNGHDQDATPAGVDEALRQRMRHRFEVWLDDVLADEPAPDGIDARILEALQQTDPGEDQDPPAASDDRRVALVTAVTALTQEVKLQGRTFNQLREALPAAPDWDTQLATLGQAQSDTAETLRQLTEALQSLVQAQQAAAQTAPDNPLVEVLLDLHDRLDRGLRSCQAALSRLERDTPRTRWRALFASGSAGGAELRAIVEGLEQGYALTLQRITEALQHEGISPIECRGAPFDPHTMVAANVVLNADVPEGTVLEVYQGGFRCHEQVLTPAKVKVTTQRRPEDTPHGRQD